MINFANLIHYPEQPMAMVINLVVLLCVFAVLVSVLIDFVEFQTRSGVKKEKRSFVETGTMFLFFVGFYSLLRFSVGRFEVSLVELKIILIVAGLLLIIIGCLVNIRGRLFLGKNWANQIKIYQDHSFISSGPYRFIRHPLYASIIWMFFGASLVYSNYLACLANLLIFTPLMYLRAKQEEALLSQEFPDYRDYQKKVGLFFPKL